MYNPRSSHTSTFFESDYVNFVTDTITKTRSVVAKKNIKKGDLIISEHVYKGSSQELCNMVQKNSYFFNSLYPRKLEWNVENSPEQSDLGQDKVTFNSFMIDYDLEKQSLCLGDKISFFNHHCDCNAYAIISTIETRICDIVIMSVVAIKDIKSNEEIFINYGSKHGHTDTFDYKCECGVKEENMRDKIRREQSEMAYKIVRKEKFERCLQNYFKSPEIISVVFVCILVIKFYITC